MVLTDLGDQINTVQPVCYGVGAVSKTHVDRMGWRWYEWLAGARNECSLSPPYISTAWDTSQAPQTEANHTRPGPFPAARTGGV